MSVQSPDRPAIGSADAPPAVPIYRALLPDADALLPYLRIIDANRHYANRGELVRRLETRLRERIAAPGCAVLTAASGTAALQAAILAQTGRADPARPFALIAGYTFVATAMAAEACGYIPVFVDIDPATWAIDPAALRQHDRLARTGIVLAVAPYGRPHDQQAWADFATSTGVPVVIDAAASFEALMQNPATLTGTVPVVLSFHATKAFATGEGGAVIWSDIEGLKRCARAMNFGFLYSRESRAAGFNGKMSEYHAAIGLAALDGWDATAAASARLAARYRAIAMRAGLGDRLILAPEIASNYALFRADSRSVALASCACLETEAIEHRFWYGPGLHREPYFAAHRPAALPVTEACAAALLGIPVFPDIDEPAIERIIAALARTAP